jgi:processive 1,2-diacylglycerol beta-glucosyltransferase
MKILITYATAGAGHKKAAEAVYRRLSSSPEHQVVFLDVLEYTNPFYRQSYSRGYTFLITRLPWLWGLFFSFLDKPWMFGVMAFVRRLHNMLNAQAFHRYLEEQQFDYIFSTHFLPNEVSAALKRQGKIRSKIISIITDYDVHRIWISRGIDYYAVASHWTKRKIVLLGVEAEKVFVTGIPTDEKFSCHEDSAALKKKLGLKEGVFTVLIATGSFGIGPIEEIAASLKGIQILVICGHNQKLYKRLSQKADSLIKIYGFVNNMDELMAVSDAMITKPGGLSISEALVMGLPLIFFNAIPGQEENNVKVLATYGVGLSGCPVVEMAQILKGFQMSSEDLSAARLRSHNLGRPNAVKDILALLGR